VAVSVASFVPKPHSVFQWEAMATRPALARKQVYLRKKAGNRKKLRLNFTGIESSFLEAALSRGDRRTGDAVLRAWELGARFDGWSDCFSSKIWASAFSESGLDPEFYVNRERDPKEVFPWDHIDSGVSRDFLLAEKEKARKALSTPSCQYEGCQRCGACSR
jgi:hypothetical protein